MILNGLIPQYKGAIANGYTYSVFPFLKNNLFFHVFFDFAKSPFKLGFLLQNSDFNFWINVNKGFTIEPFIESNKFYTLVKLLGLKADSFNKFSARLFFKQFNNTIPNTFSYPEKKVVIHVAQTKYKIEEEECIYYSHLTTWSDRLRSDKNSEKTRLLYPELYKSIQHRKNISVCYTNQQVNDEATSISEDLNRIIRS